MSDSVDSSSCAEELVSISEAARRLGVSERTVYRLLRAGKLRRVVAENMSDKCQTGVWICLTEEGISGLNRRGNDVVVRQMSENMSDSQTNGILEELRTEMRSKEEQIAKLLEVQSEMTRTIQQLHEQMYELARLVLMQKVQGNGPTTPEQGREAQTPPKAPPRKWTLFRRSDNSS